MLWGLFCPQVDHPQTVISGGPGMSHVAGVKESRVTCPVLTAPMVLMDTWESERKGKARRAYAGSQAEDPGFPPSLPVLDIKGLPEKTGEVFL